MADPVREPDLPPDLFDADDQIELQLGNIGQLNSQRKSTARRRYTLGFAPIDGRPHERPKPRKRRKKRV